ncbi:uncharacterized protein [Typha angustifolia]|uniref:uncharacterized protein isoform X2 n=1 Tax=Typha angustifolia TaxID=59011 RepID=UPI003C2B912D
MAGSTRAELASSNLDGSTFSATYSNGQRGAYSGSNSDRSGSFRESLENRVSVSVPGASRSMASPVEIPPVTQYLSLEPFSMGEQKYTRLGELRRVLAVPLEEHPFGSFQLKPLPLMEDVKRFKASLLESATKARDRSKVLDESILKLDKYRNILSRKRQRSDLPTEKSGSSNLLKMGTQTHQNPAELLGQRLEDRAKNVVPNKRARSSLADVRLEGRGHVPMRQGPIIDKEKSLFLDKDKGMLKACNGGQVLSEDKLNPFSPGGEGWEKKLKRKRSVGTVVNRVNDGDRQVKQTTQQRTNSETRLRASDSLGLRTGSSSGVAGSNKIDGSSQQSGAGSRVIPKIDMDNGPLPNERRERPAGLDKERILAKGNNKLNIREDVQAGNQSPLNKAKASRAPRTSSAFVMNSSSNVPRLPGGTDGWEQASCPNKVQPLSGVTNRKRPIPTGSSSPPVAQWVGQRPQKITRTRRANVVSPVSNFDEAHILPEGFTPPDIGARPASLESSGLLISRGIPNPLQQSKLKQENISSPARLSESEESGPIDSKFQEKGVGNVEMEDGATNVVHKATTLVLPMKKNKILLKEEFRDGVRRQGRSGRGSVHAKACLPLLKEKMESSDATKPLKSGKSGSDKSERVGRPPSKKMSDRKACARPGQVAQSVTSDLTVETNDDREELLAAATAARNASYAACCSPFWKKMEPVFTFVTMEDITFVKNQITLVEELDRSTPNFFDADDKLMDELPGQVLPSPLSSFFVEESVTKAGPNKPVGISFPDHDLQLVKMVSGKLSADNCFEEVVPLSQKLLSAFIIEEENELLDCNEQGNTLLQFSSDYFPHVINSHVENQNQALTKSDFQLDLEFENSKNHSADKMLCNGHTASSNFRNPNIQSSISGDDLLADNSFVLHSENGLLSRFMPTNSRQLHSLDTTTSFSGTSPCEGQFEHMSLNERILMELHSIGLYPEKVPKLDEGEIGEIDKAISQLQMKLCQKVKQKKIQLQKLDKAIQDAKQVEERNLQHLAMNKLVETAYRKLMGGRGGSSHKGGASKVSKQLALAFAKRTLARCHKFEQTGQSCFDEPTLRNIICAPLHSSDSKYVEVSGALASGLTSIGERPGLGHKLDRVSSDPYQGDLPEQTSIRTEPITNRGRKREVPLDDVTGSASRATTTLSNHFSGGPKWKRTERDREQGKDASTRNSTAKAGRLSVSSGKVERKTKTKPKQKIVQLSSSGNGLGRVTETANLATPSMRDSGETMNTSDTKFDQEVEIQSAANVAQDSSKEIDDTILTSLPCGQDQDIGSWLNFDDDTLLDHDLVGLEIPLDDLSDLKLDF